MNTQPGLPAGEATRISNRIRGPLTQVHPALERVLGPESTHPAVLELLSRCGGPTGLRKAGRAKLSEIVTARAPRGVIQRACVDADYCRDRRVEGRWP